MKGIILRDHEVLHLASSGSVLIWRSVKPQPVNSAILADNGIWYDADCIQPGKEMRCPHGRTGEARFVKETGYWIRDGGDGNPCVAYRAENVMKPHGCSWRSPAQMPSWASRFRVTLSVSCRQIQSVSEEEAERSGAEFGFWHEDQGVFATPVDEDDEGNSCFRDGFGFVIESRYPGSWERKDWFWAIEAKEVK